MHFFMECQKLTDQELISYLDNRKAVIRRGAASELQMKGGKEICNIAKLLCDDLFYQKREIGAFILGQIRGIEKKDLDDIFELLRGLSLTDKSALVRSSALCAMAHRYGYCEDSKWAEKLIESCSILVQETSVFVRQSVAFALSLIKDIRTIYLLENLSKDSSNLVKNWAAFAINIHKYDTAEIRESFVEMLNSQDREIQLEAITGLSRVKDQRVVAVLKQELLCALESDTVLDDIIRAVSDLGDSGFIPLLEQLVKQYYDEDGFIQNTIDSLKTP
ncbi:HEAT repeat domain-containing protein [Ignatzschineria sp. LJL83]